MFFLITGSVDVFVKDKIVTTLGQARALASPLGPKLGSILALAFMLEAEMCSVHI